MKKLSFWTGLFALLLLTPSGSAQAHSADAQGCSDSPLITRIAGSTLTACHNAETQQVSVSTGKDAAGNILTKSVAGGGQSWTYRPPKSMNGVQAFQSIETLLKEAGFTIVYEESPKRLTANRGNDWYLLDNKDGSYTQTILAASETTQTPPAETSSATAELESTGHAVIYGIQFDPATGAVQGDADSILRPFLDSLRSNPALKIRVECYTDNVGPAADNLALSRKESEGIVKWFVDHGVDKARLASQGMGSANPLVDNDNDEDRAKNRRVEIVKM